MEIRENAITQNSQADFIMDISSWEIKRKDKKEMNQGCWDVPMNLKIKRWR